MRSALPGRALSCVGMRALNMGPSWPVLSQFATDLATNSAEIRARPRGFAYK